MEVGKWFLEMEVILFENLKKVIELKEKHIILKKKVFLMKNGSSIKKQKEQLQKVFFIVLMVLNKKELDIYMEVNHFGNIMNKINIKRVLFIYLKNHLFI